MVRDMVLEAIKPRDILEYYGIEEKRGRFLCPFHKDTNPSMTIKVACLPDDENVILGYKMGEPGHKFYYSYVKIAFRGMGIEKELEEAK